MKIILVFEKHDNHWDKSVASGDSVKWMGIKDRSLGHDEDKMKRVIKIRPMIFIFVKHSVFYCDCEHRKQNKFQVTERTFYFIMVSKNYENSIGNVQ